MDSNYGPMVCSLRKGIFVKKGVWGVTVYNIEDLDHHKEGHKRRDVPEKISAGLKVQHCILGVMFPQFPHKNRKVPWEKEGPFRWDSEHFVPRRAIMTSEFEWLGSQWRSLSSCHLFCGSWTTCQTWQLIHLVMFVVFFGTILPCSQICVSLYDISTYTAHAHHAAQGVLTQTFNALTPPEPNCCFRWMTTAWVLSWWCYWPTRRVKKPSPSRPMI